VQEEEDPVDHQEVLIEKCSELAKCSKFREELDTCNERVTSKTKTSETCEQELFDFVHCVDHCVSDGMV
jgi:ubiquinol-cytochrome c reductase subunit 6